MGLLDRLFGKGQEQPEETAISKKTGSTLPQDSSDIEKAIAERASHLGDYKRIPLGEIATLGGIFAELSPVLRTVTQTVTTNGMGYIPINLGGATLKQFAKNMPDIYAGAFRSLSTGKSTMAQWVKLGPQSITTASTCPSVQC